jgi:hypothetical protein
MHIVHQPKSLNFIRRIRCEVENQQGEKGTVLMFSTLAGAVRRQTNGEVRCELIVRQFIEAFGFVVTGFEARSIGGEEDKLNGWEETHQRATIESFEGWPE